VVSGIVERRHTLPILANLLFKKNGEKVSFISTDIEIQLQPMQILVLVLKMSLQPLQQESC
jgi:DNA polymerase III sliding clamp (beta) subunit (PCNA family)